VNLVGAGLGALVGVALGMLGGGGSILTVPIFVYVLGFGTKVSIAMSLGVVAIVSVFGATAHWRAGNVDVRVAIVFGSVAMVGTYLGARLAAFVSGEVQLMLFAGVMLAAAFAMMRPRNFEPNEPKRGLGPALLIAGEGLAVGILTGLVGVGGGFLIVPALVILGGLSMKQAVGTSLMVIALKSTAGFVGYLGQVEIPWVFMFSFAAVASIGILAGTMLSKFVSHAALQRAFAVLLIVMGGAILYANRATLIGGGAVAIHETATIEAVMS